MRSALEGAPPTAQTFAVAADVFISRCDKRSWNFVDCRVEDDGDLIVRQMRDSPARIPPDVVAFFGANGR